MNEYEILTRAREIVADPNKWGKEHLATDEKGDDVVPADPKAKTWCALGAIGKVAGIIDQDVCYAEGEIAPPREYVRAVNHLAKTIRTMFPLFDYGSNNYSTVYLVNDDLGYDQILEAFDKAIADAPASGTPNL